MTSNQASHAGGILLKSLSSGERFELNGAMVVGRGSACDIVIEQERLSRTHAKLTAGDDSVLIEDLGSTNGTFLNDQRVEGEVLAKHGDIIKFDSYAFEVYVEGRVDQSGATVIGSAVPQEEVVEAKTQMFTAPKSWALDDRPSAEGTQIMSLDMLKKNAALEREVGADIAEHINIDVPVLVCLSGKFKGKVFKFNTRDKLTKWEIGRADSCEIQVDDASISTNHAQLVHEGKRWKLIDLMSANGTYVNGNKGLTSYLSSGDNVRFGQVEFIFKLNSSGETTDPIARPALSKSKNNSIADGGSATPKEPLVVPKWLLAVGAFLLTAVILYFILA